MPSTRSSVTVIAVLIALLAVAGCGKKGRLYLPPAGTAQPASLAVWARHAAP